MTDKYEPIPYTPGDPQPRISDGVYRAIRMDGAGGYEGIRQETLMERLQDACVGHPASLIPWPHRLLHDAIAEIGRLRSIVRVNLLRHVPDATHAAIDALLDAPEVASEAVLRNVLRDIANLDASNVGWAPGMAARALGIGLVDIGGRMAPKLTERGLEVAVNGH